MSVPTSILEELLQAIPDLHPQIFFKSSLTALSHAMEDQVLAGAAQPLVIASFQRERFYRQEASRYQRIAECTGQVYVLAAPETDFTHRSEHYETIAFDPTEPLSQEWHLVVLGPQYASCLVCHERETIDQEPDSKLMRLSEQLPMDQVRRFEGIWTFDRAVTSKAADLLLDRILGYRPELAEKIAEARAEFLVEQPQGFNKVNPGPFADRLVTYLQAGQYKLMKAYRSIAAQERKERLVNSITAAIRRSLDPDQILGVAVQELGQALDACRCLIYRCKASDSVATIQFEFLGHEATSLLHQSWPLQTNPLFQEIVTNRELVYIEAVSQHPQIQGSDTLKALVARCQISTWLLVPVLYQDRLLGMLELHHCACEADPPWTGDDVALVEAIAIQVGVALIQAEAYSHLEDLNQQLEALDRTRSNLVAITGHELRTPLSTIQICLESLSSEPDMPRELQQVMLSTALTDAERMRKLVQDFLTLSRLESGRVEWHLESLPLRECVDLALSSIRTRVTEKTLPQIKTKVPTKLPLVRADGEWLVEVLAKLVDNACKFTQPEGQVVIQARRCNDNQMMEVTVADTGRGIEPNRLEVVFDRFYQEEGALRRSAGGTGLGLAICRQIVNALGGEIWAESAGRDQGSAFHFTIPIVEDNPEQSAQQDAGASSQRQNGNSTPVRKGRSTIRQS
ncbi:histidine kinase [Leptolyngbya sp. 'hensonii']|uniref:DICT sensory domain-containing protein n=1 Tax=Leptolyngbya sp. 'hensonii' TaxID=1922337 RepID=UPI00095026A7|nr:DICT sensory domain-containing protein [Leptolyngbya sp. 'hensonii']OLP18774.1 histidine kinase [Leptolyngbya sp. 'hensonii']